MPFDPSIKKVLVIGSGPIIIGQGAEFDYSGTQCCFVLKEEGIETVLINNNPATIMTDYGVSDRTYLEPLTSEFIEEIIRKESPTHVIATMGGQTGLNLILEMHELDIFNRYNLKFAGTSIDSIKKGENRRSFKALMETISEPIIESAVVKSVQEAVEYVNDGLLYPLVVRPAYTLGGTGGGFVECETELRKIVADAIHASKIGEALIEKSVKGWKEIEFEIVRDSQANSIVVCSMENIDPVGIHTGDSVVVAPTLTLANREYQMLRRASLKVVDAANVVGACNVQIALNPKSFEYAIIEINPRVSRSSALASKATGYKIARVATKVALGYTLDEIKNQVTNRTFACFEPALDYVVVKIPKWPFDKFVKADRRLGTKMMSTGEVAAIGKTFEQALLKAIRSLNSKQATLEVSSLHSYSTEELCEMIESPCDERLFELSELIRRGCDINDIHDMTGIDLFFLNKFKNLVDFEEKLKRLKGEDLTPEFLLECKKKGYGDRGIGELIGLEISDICKMRKKHDLLPSYSMIDTCACEFPAVSSYYYSNYSGFNESFSSNAKKVVIIGSGPIKIGQGIEFDYTATKAAIAIKKLGYEAIMINNNPETVSTDFDISSKLYFEPLSEEEVLNVIELERPRGVVLQFGGHTAIELAKFLTRQDVRILGTELASIDISEDRDKFYSLLEHLGVKRPDGSVVSSVKEGILVANQIGYPVLARPSYVLGGQGMEIICDEDELCSCLERFFAESDKGILIDKYLKGRELEVDAISDGKTVVVPGIMEHLDSAGVHSGDSICIYPPINISDTVKDRVVDITEKISIALHVIGLVNIQFIEYLGEVYVIEVNPRSSRTVPFMSKVTKIDMVGVASRILFGETLSDMGFSGGLCKEIELYSVKFPIFSTEKLPNVEVGLGPEMRSTGEIMGIGRTPRSAIKRAFCSANFLIPSREGIVILTIADKEKENFLSFAKRFSDLGMLILATQGTFEFLMERGVHAQVIRKFSEKVPNIVSVIGSGVVDLIVNIPQKGNDCTREGFKLRRLAAENGVNIVTSLDTVGLILDIMENPSETKDVEIFELNDIN